MQTYSIPLATSRSPKYLRERAFELFREIADEYEFEIREMEFTVDHVHLFLSLPPRYSITDAMRILKIINAREIYFVNIHQSVRSSGKGSVGRMDILHEQLAIKLLPI